MRSFRQCALVILAVLAVVSCEGERGEPGPAGPVGPGGPPGVQTLRVGIVTSRHELDVMRGVVIALRTGLFPFGTILEYVSARGRDVPTLEDLEAYDVLLAYAMAEPQYPDSIGDVLADYVDQGGRIVLAQAAFALPDSASGQGGLGYFGGRIMEDGYSPFKPTNISFDNDNRCIDPNSLDFPYHPIFNGIDINNVNYLHQYNLSNPELQLTATLIALDDIGVPAVAINADGTVMATNIIGTFEQSFADHAMGYRLLANMVTFLGYRLEAQVASSE